MFRYIPIEHRSGDGDGDGGNREQSYGLRVLRSEAGEDRELMILPGVSTDFGFTLRLASLLTRKQVDPQTLLERLEDLL